MEDLAIGSRRTRGGKPTAHGVGRGRRIPVRWGGLVLCLFMGVLLVPGLLAQVSEVKRDEQVIFFPTVGRRIAAQPAWALEIRGCVYEPEKRRVALAALRQVLKFTDVKMTSAQKTTFAERARLFMVDNERGNNIVIGIGNRLFPAGRSGPDGHFSAVVKLNDSDLPRQPDGPMEIRAILPRDDVRRFTGEITLVDDEGVFVLSDIDDTIKLTEVTDRNAMLRNTFLEPFRPVPGMADFYRQLAEQPDLNFCYVSASPWQLFLPLSEFIRSNAFPSGSFWLRKFRWKDESFFNLFNDPGRYKRGVIQPLLKQFPHRNFILIGDSGEQDPEVYADLAQEFPGRIKAILIRDINGETLSSARYRGLRLPEGCQFIVFRAPSEIGDPARFF
jgi:hypothetical protein